MIKIIATAALGLGLLSTTASADVSHCGVNDSRMNPTELSAYQECWLDEYRNDDHGVLGSLFWVHVGGEYYSTQLRNLRTQAGRDMFLADIEADVEIRIEEAQETADSVTVYAEKIVEVEVIKEVIEVVKEIVLKDMGEYTDEDYIHLLGVLNDKRDEMRALEAELKANDIDPAAIKESVDAIYDAGYTKGDYDLYKWIQSQTKMKPSKLIAAYNELKAIADSTPEDFPLPSTKGKQLHSTTPTVIEYIDSAGTSITLTDKGNNKIYIDVETELNTLLSGNLLSDVEDVIVGLVNASYEAGYDDGYIDGYKAGYADGYTAALAD